MLTRRLAQLAEQIGDVRLLAIIGFDGLAVEKIVFDNTLDADALAAEVGSVARDIIASDGDLAVGQLRQFSISVGDLIVMLAVLSREYSLLLVADAAIGHGRARFELRRVRLILEDLLAAGQPSFSTGEEE